MFVRHRLVLFVVVITLLAACGTPAQPDAAALEATIEARLQATLAAQPPTATAAPPTATVVPPTNTSIPTNTALPTPPPSPTSPPRPTITPSLPTATPTSVATLADKVLLHVIQETVDRSGVQVELRQVAIASKQWLEGNGATFAGKYADVPTIATVYFRVTNTRQDTINLYVNQATVVVNSEQIELAPYIIEGRVGDDLGGEFLPGVEAIGSISFPIERSTVPEIERMLVKINGPATESFERLGEDIEFTLDLSEHRVDPALPGTLETN